MATDRLGPEAWVTEAFAVLPTQGIEGVRVEPIAQRLGVTKGSFYWHFADRRALLDAVLDRWEREATAAVIDRVEAAATSPKARLRKLIELTARLDETAAVEQALRAWGSTDRSARRRLSRVDQQREAYVCSLLEAAGLPPARAVIRARLFYLTLIGEFSWVSLGGTPSTKALWRELFDLITEP